MRARIIKPGFWTCEELRACSERARLLFIGLLQIADREGRLENKPTRIGLLLAVEWDVPALLGELERAGLIWRYEVGDERCIVIPKFTKHQHLHPREAQSELPPPPAKARPKAGERRGPKPGNYPAESRVKLPEAEAEAEAEAERKDLKNLERASTPGGFQGGGTQAALLPVAAPERPPAASLARRPARKTAEGFNARLRALLDAYPCGDKVPAAAKELATLEYGLSAEAIDALHVAILDGIARWKGSEEWTDDGGRYVPLLASFLRDHRWQDHGRAAPRRKLTHAEQAVESGRRALEKLRQRREGTQG